MKDIKASISIQNQVSLEYLNYMRNKWAGHAGLDREFDKWAGVDTGLSLPLVEDALVRLVNAHEKLAEVIAGSSVLQGLVETPPIVGAGATAIPFRVEWGAVTPLAMVAREWGARAADALLDQLQCPPGYGTVDDTDWGPGSEHQHRWALVDAAAQQAIDAG